ncbi:hypothetical protein GCM10023174_10260 [Chelativorans composti]|uniref:Uncharacterized protein n=1 Tax=Chelativorans composti TaxID=768533 RepID=A0ABW5DJF7_9HYPH
MKMPLRRFWFFVSQVDRLRAEEEIRQLRVLAAVTSSDAYKKAIEVLQEEMGEIYIWEPLKVPPEMRVDPETGLDPEFDREGLRALKMKLAAQARTRR